MEPIRTQEQLNDALAASPSNMRLTPEMIEGKIANESYVENDSNTLTVCVLTLENGFTVTGTSACADPKNYNQAIGRKVARDNAVREIWPLEGYLLRQRLYESGIAATRN